MITRLIAKFSLAQLLVWTVPILSAVALAQYSKPSEWVGVSLGMAIGAAAGLFVSGGWSLQGASVLINDLSNRDSIILRSSVQRTLSFVVVVPILALMCFLMYQTEFIICFISACATAAIGAGPRWHLSATGEVARLVRLDIAPRAIGGLLSIVVILTQGSVFLYCLTVLASQLTPILISVKDKKAWWHELRKWNLSAYLKAMKSNGYSTSAELVSAATVASPMVLASLAMDPYQNPEVATAFRIFGLAVTAITILSNASQSASMIEVVDKRSLVVRNSLIYSIALAFIGLASLSFAAKDISSLLFPKFEVYSNTVFVVFGFAFFSTSIATHFLRHVVLYLKLYRAVLISNLVALAACAITAYYLHQTAGINIENVAIPYAVAEAITLLSIYVYARRAKSSL